MAITNVELKSAALGGSATGGQDGIVSTSYTAQYQVDADTSTRSPAAVLAHFQQNADLPWPGRSYNLSGGYDPFSLCKSVNVKYTDKSEVQFLVDVSYESSNGQGQEEKQDQNGKSSNNPLLWADEIDVSYTQQSIPVEVGEFRAFQPFPIDNPFLQPGKITPIVNSANKPYDPTLEEESQIKILRISKYSKTCQSEAFNKYIGSINSDRVVINKPSYGFSDSFEPYRGLIRGLSAQFAITNGIPHFRQTVELHISSLLYGWFRPIIDRGLSARRAVGDPDGQGGVIGQSDITPEGATDSEEVKDKEGVPTSEPVLFNGKGQPLKYWQQPVYLIYNVRRILPFSPIRW